MDRPRVLFVDDDKTRHLTFRFYCAEVDLLPDVAWTADEAADLLERTRYDLVFLDHDLAEEHHEAGYMAGRPGDGTALVRWMVGPGRAFLPRSVVIHSYNASAAERMAGILAPAVPVVRSPFGSGLKAFLVALEA